MAGLQCGRATCLCAEQDIHDVRPRLPDGFFLCVARTLDGVLRSGWATPESGKLLRLSAVKAKLAGMCMFGGVDSPSADDLTRTFLQHRDNVSLLLQAQEEPRASQDEHQAEDAGDAGAEYEQSEESSAERSLAMLLAGSEKLEQALSTGDSPPNQQDGTPDVQMQGDGQSCLGNSLQDAANHGGGGQSPLQQTTADDDGRRGIRVDIPTAHCCGHSGCVCATECIAVHEVEPALPRG